MSAAMLDAIKRRWLEYLIETAGLGIFMILACAFGVLLEHPSSTLCQAIADSFTRRVLMGDEKISTLAIGTKRKKSWFATKSMRTARCFSI